MKNIVILAFLSLGIINTYAEFKTVKEAKKALETSYKKNFTAGQSNGAARFKGNNTWHLLDQPLADAKGWNDAVGGSIALVRKAAGSDKDLLKPADVIFNINNDYINSLKLLYNGLLYAKRAPLTQEELNTALTAAVKKSVEGNERLFGRKLTTQEIENLTFHITNELKNEPVIRDLPTAKKQEIDQIIKRMLDATSTLENAEKGLEKVTFIWPAKKEVRDLLLKISDLLKKISFQAHLATMTL